MLKTLLCGLCAILLAACNTAATRDADSVFFRIPAGSKLILNNSLDIPAGQAHVKFQRGRIVGGVDEYSVNCRFTVRNLGPSVVKPDTFIIERAGSQQEWAIRPTVMRFYRRMYLKSAGQPDVSSMTCQFWADPREGWDVSVPQMRETLGDYFSFEFVQ